VWSSTTAFSSRRSDRASASPPRLVRDELVAGLSQDYGVHPYGKWRGAFWRLASLVELGVARNDSIDAAADSVLAWLANPRRLRSFPTLEGRVRRCASQDGLALYVLSALGFDDERLQILAESLVASQWPDGGWNCDRRPAAAHSSFNETWGPTLGLAAHGRAVGERHATVAAEAAAEFLLRHQVFQSHRTGEPAHPALLNLRFPPYWHYDVLVGLVTLARSVGLDDRRVATALDLVESRRLPDGTWQTEGKWWKRPGSKGSNVEAVDWGDTANELLTDRALEVLHAGGRQ
jgi:hypothetical protein